MTTLSNTNYKRNSSAIQLEVGYSQLSFGVITEIFKILNSRRSKVIIKRFVLLQRPTHSHSTPTSRPSELDLFSGHSPLPRRAAQPFVDDESPEENNKILPLPPIPFHMTQLNQVLLLLVASRR